MKQQCPIAFIYLGWLMYVGVPVYLASRGEWILIAVWLVALPLSMWLYVSTFPRTSRFWGYGTVEDRAAVAKTDTPIKVTFYTALGCRFCPIVERRLESLRDRMGFVLEKVDVTGRPDLVAGKGIFSVPVIEAGAKQHVGNATSSELAELIASAAGVPERASA